jgi:hypothetical protein
MATIEKALQIVTVLQDVIEETSVSADDLGRAGFSESVVAAVLYVNCKISDGGWGRYLRQ